MPSEAELSPEEKLLKVIQQGNKGDGSPASKVSATSPPARQDSSPPKVSSATAVKAARLPAGSGPSAPAAPPAAKKGPPPQAKAPVLPPAPPVVPPAAAPPKVAKQAAADAGEKKLTLQPKAPAETTAGAKQLGSAAPEAKREESPAPSPPRSRSSRATFLRTVKRGLMVASLLLGVVVVMELVQAGPGLPTPPSKAVSPVFPGKIAPLREEQEYVAGMQNHDIFRDFTAPQVVTTGSKTNLPAGAPKDFDAVSSYVQKNLKLDGISMNERESASFVMVTEQFDGGAQTHKWKTGETFPVPGAPEGERLSVSKILANDVIFLYQGKEIRLPGRR
jgi:hypothetical protein